MPPKSKPKPKPKGKSSKKETTTTTTTTEETTTTTVSIEETETKIETAPKAKPGKKSAKASAKRPLDESTEGDAPPAKVAKPAKSGSKSEAEILQGTTTFVRKSNDGDFSSEKHWKILSWNVDGLRAVIKNGKSLEKLISDQKPDVLCMQETKLQSKDSSDCGAVDGYKMFDNCSKAKLGYSGTRVYVKNGIEIVKVHYGLKDGSHDEEGRSITVEFKDFYLVNTYVPNAGMKLERLTYRVGTWDKAMLSYLLDLQKSKPVVWTGDLNVAERDYDRFFTGDWKAMQKAPGFTPEERDSFRDITNEKHGLVDSFRHLYPTAAHVYSFWNPRFGTRETNKGWRLDYFVVSKSILPKVFDTYMLKDVTGSDHCPISLWLEK